jgi:hypothetical protein
MLCPRCQFEQPDGSPECARCGIVFSRWEELHAGVGTETLYRPQPAPATSAASPEDLRRWPWPWWQELGDLSYAFGRGLMLAAFAWGGWSLAQQRRRLPSTMVAESFERKNH